MAAGRSASKLRPVPPGRDFRRAQKEPVPEQIASFVGFFAYLLILKSFFLPLFIIPTGSMAETLYGEHATHTCPNCGVDYPVQLPPREPFTLQCPNCRWHEYFGSQFEVAREKARGVPIDAIMSGTLRQQAGDRIMVHGWTYDLGGPFAPQRWDVVVFKVPTDGDTNYIKRLIGRPGETIEIIDGDLFVTEPGATESHIAHKTREAQRSLWFPYYDQDHPPRSASANGTYRPRWMATADSNGWSGLDTRDVAFDGSGKPDGEILFVTDTGSAPGPGQVNDIYGYDGPGTRPHAVQDVRLSCEITLQQADAGGFVELSTTKYGDEFFARLYGDGRVTFEHARKGGTGRETWGETKVPAGGGPVRLGLSNVDYVAGVEIDGRIADGLRSSPAQYDVTAEQARSQSAQAAPPRLAIAAHGVKARLSHVLIERDEYYTSDLNGEPGYGTQGHPIHLGPHDYFVLGDNSPASLDARFSFAQSPTDPVGPHLKAAYAAGRYQLGTVPADQLIGPAFLVYWPGTDALLPDQYLPQPLRLLNQLPDPGLIRWIR